MLCSVHTSKFKEFFLKDGYKTRMLGNQKQHIYRMTVAEMRMLGWMSGKTRKD